MFQAKEISSVMCRCKKIRGIEADAEEIVSESNNIDVLIATIPECKVGNLVGDLFSAYPLDNMQRIETSSVINLSHLRRIRSRKRHEDQSSVI